MRALSCCGCGLHLVLEIGKESDNGNRQVYGSVVGRNDRIGVADSDCVSRDVLRDRERLILGVRVAWTHERRATGY